MQIQGTPYLQYFCGYPCFDDSKPPFDASLMVHFRKRITPEILAEINEMIIREVRNDKKDNDDDNSGTMIVDATCALSHIRYPQDVSLLNEAAKLQEMIEAFRMREGHYPIRVLADKIYRNCDNLRFCKEHGVRISGPALGRPKKNEIRDKEQDYKDECESVEVERRFSLTKRKCGMGLVTAKRQETAECVLAMSILVLNLRRAQSALLRLLCWFANLFCHHYETKEKYMLVQ